MTKEASTTATPFGDIMRRAVVATPNAIGGAFAARDGEMVDSYATGDPFDFAVLTAQYGVVLALLHAAFGTLHHGGVDYYIARYAKLDLVLYSVDAGYYAVMAIAREPDAQPDNEPFGDALATLAAATKELRREMG